MIVNPDKFQAIVLGKRKSNKTDVRFVISSEEIQALPSFDMLGIKIDLDLLLVQRKFKLYHQLTY